MLTLPFCNGETFQIFLDDFANNRPDELKVVVLDNGAFHKAKSLVIPDNIILIFLPPYSPELNPAEKIWAHFKRDFSNKVFSNLNLLEEYTCDLCCNLETERVKSTCNYNYVRKCSFWSNI